jgi:curved DNA-binding protein CbpA
MLAPGFAAAKTHNCCGRTSYRQRGIGLVKSLYDILEVSSVASDEVVTAAYRALSKKYHPDKNPDADVTDATMAAINHAYAILSDPEQRKAYDAASGRSRSARGFEPPPQRPAPAPQPQTSVYANFARPRSSKSAPRIGSFAGGLLAIAGFALAVTVGIYAASAFESDSASAISLLAHPDPHAARLRKAEALLKGDGIAQNFLQAKAEFEAIVESRSPFETKDFRGLASQKLAEIHYNGLGVPKDTAKAEEWFRKAAESGPAVGPAPALTVARFFEEGINGTTDKVEAYRWYNAAAGIPYNAQTSAISLDEYTQIVDLANQKKAALASVLSPEQLDRAQQSPLPPCKTFMC